VIAIPAMDIIDGSCVRLRMGDYSSKRVYDSNPLEVAKRFADAGLKQLHLVDLDGAKAGHVVNMKVLESIATHTDLVIDVGGGLQSPQDFSSVFSAGAHMATVGSLAARDRGTTLELLATWGAQKLILGADCSDGKIAISGWASMTDLELHEFVAAYLAEGFLKVVSTDISKDGMLGGPATNMYVQLLEEMRERALPIELIASGGIRNLVDLDTLSQAGLHGAIIGKALYEGKIDADQLATWQAAGSGLDVG